MKTKKITLKEIHTELVKIRKCVEKNLSDEAVVRLAEKMENGSNTLTETQPLRSRGETEKVEQYADEVVPSSYTYPERYKVKPIDEQIKTLKKFFPTLNTKVVSWRDIKIPEGTEGLFAIPRWQLLGGTYNDALDVVLSKLKETRLFYNYSEGQTDSEYLRESEQKKEMMNKLYKQQNADILIVLAQLGMKHRGESIRRARETFLLTEFGLGAYEVGIILLTHPLRMQKLEELDIDCAGDEYAWNAGGDFSRSLCFVFDGGGAGFGCRSVGSAYGRFGSASGFLTQ